jgi:hypothetical protein
MFAFVHDLYSFHEITLPRALLIFRTKHIVLLSREQGVG